MLLLYYYGDVGPLDDKNPYYYYKQNEAPSLLLDLAYGRHVPSSELLNHMIQVGMVNEDKTLNFPFFLKEDVCVMTVYADKMSEKMLNELKLHLNEMYRLCNIADYDYKEVLYHWLCCDILDGDAMEEYGEMSYFSLGSRQKSNRHYLLIGFEDNKALTSLSQKLLCSCNVYHHSKIEFKSFGDADGDRNDWFRFYKQQDEGLFSASGSVKVKQAYTEIIQSERDKLLNKAYDVVVGHSEDEMIIQLLEAFNYMKNGKLSVPVFTPEHRLQRNTLSKAVIEWLSPFVETMAKDVENLKLKANIHGVDSKAIANEIWHQIFGALNEKLVKDGIVAAPKYYEGEGRYLKAIYLKGE